MREGVAIVNVGVAIVNVIERVARALCVADGHHPDTRYRFTTHAPEGFACVLDTDKLGWTIYRDRAIAAIAAMEEPTDAMIRAGNRHTNCGGACGNETALRVWDAMIDAAAGE